MKRRTNRASKGDARGPRRSGKIIGRRSRKLGLPPGTLIHIGEKKAEHASIAIRDYDEGRLNEVKTDQVEMCVAFRDRPTVTWVNVDGIHDVTIVEKVGTCFGIHPLVLEDVVNTGQRSKLEDFGDYLFLVLKTVGEGSPEGGVDYNQMSLILGSNFVLTFQETEGEVFSSVLERLRNEKSRLRRMGADYLAYSLLDVVVDNYFVVLEKIGDRIENLEDEVVDNPNQDTFREIHELKREMMLLRKAVWPLREVLGGLARGESPQVQDATHVYLRDVYDHTVQIIETMETFRDLLSGFVDVYLSSVSNRMNAVMKVLTIIATIFMPLTFIAGVYGMNFKYMPELEWHWGYPMVLLLMSLTAGAMVLFFLRRGWIAR